MSYVLSRDAEREQHTDFIFQQNVTFLAVCAVLSLVLIREVGEIWTREVSFASSRARNK